MRFMATENALRRLNKYKLTEMEVVQETRFFVAMAFAERGVLCDMIRCDCYLGLGVK